VAGQVLAIDVDSGAATELAFAYGAVLARASTAPT
jgi:hypothetical protein